MGEETALENGRISNFHGLVTYLLSWPSALTTRPPCAVERDTLSGRGSTRPGRVRLPKNYF